MEDLGHVSGTERVIFGARSPGEIADLVDRYLRRRLGASVADVLFRAGASMPSGECAPTTAARSSFKAHRAPVDVGARRACVAAQVMLVDAPSRAPRPIRDRTSSKAWCRAPRPCW